MHITKQSFSFNKKKEGQTLSQLNESSCFYTFVTTLNEYVSSFEDVLEGRALFSKDNLVGGSLLIELLNGAYKNELYSIDPTIDINSTALNIAIKNCCGNSTYIFTPEKVFDVIIREKIKMMYSIVESYINKSMKLLLEMNQTVLELVPYFTLYLKLKDAIKEKVLRYCEENTRICQDFCRNILNIELAYINKRHPDFMYAFESLLNTPKNDNLDKITVKAFSESQFNAKNDEEIKLTERKNKFDEELNLYSDTDSTGDLYSNSSTNVVAISTPIGHIEPTKDIEEYDTNTQLIKRLVKSYFEIVRKNIYDSSQKAIMHFLINGTKLSIQNNLIVSLQPNVSKLIQLDSGSLKERENLYIRKK